MQCMVFAIMSFSKTDMVLYSDIIVWIISGLSQDRLRKLNNFENKLMIQNKLRTIETDNRQKF